MIATKLSRLDDREDRKNLRWCGTQASSHRSHYVPDDKANEAGMSTTAPGHCVEY